MVKVTKDEGGMMKDELCYVRVVREMDVRLYGDAPQSDATVSIRILGQVRRIR